MIDRLCTLGTEPANDEALVHEIHTLSAEVLASARMGDRLSVARLETEVRADPDHAFSFAPDGTATLVAGGHSIPAGRFEVASIGELRRRAHAERRAGVGLAGRDGRARFWVLSGTGALTDIGALQSTAGPGALFQVASQFNGLESPGPHIVRVADYFADPTQGPRAAISAFPGALLRHYAAPDPSGKRFVQRDPRPQLDFLAGVGAPGLGQVRGGYLTGDDLKDPAAYATAIEQQFDAIAVGIHDAVPVRLGFDWDGAVSGDRRIAQVFTSTFAGGGYSRPGAEDPAIRAICTVLLRAAYLGTLLAAVALGRPRVGLTLIGGGVFGNPVALIWDAVLWALAEVTPHLSRDLDVVLNGRDLARHLPLPVQLAATREHGGALVVVDHERVAIVR